MKILLQNCNLLTGDPEHGVIANGHLYIDGNVIAAIGSGSGRQPADLEIDACGKLVAPGLVNAHMHCYSTFARGLALNAAPSCFVEILDKLWWRLDKALVKEDLYLSTVVPAMEAIRSGVTTFIDHHASPYCLPGCLDELARACNDAGMRALLCYEVSDRDGKEIAGQGIDENVRFCGSVNNHQDGLVKGMFGLHASFTVDDDTLARAVAEANKLGVGLHLHVAEDHADQNISLHRFASRVVPRLAAAGVLGPKSIAAHAVCTDTDEKRILAETATWTIHNPRSNMNNAVGVLDLLDLLAQKARVGLGTDGMAGSLWPEIRTAALIHKHERRNPRVIWGEILELLNNNARLAEIYFARPLGRLSVGALADVVIYDYLPPTPLNNDNFLGHFLFGFAHVRAETVIIDGRVALRNHRFTEIDECEIAARSREQASDFWRRFHTGHKGTTNLSDS